MNTGLDAILETSNKLDISGTPDVARYLVKFDTNEITDIITNKISGSTYEVYFKNLRQVLDNKKSMALSQAFN